MLADEANVLADDASMLTDAAAARSPNRRSTLADDAACPGNGEFRSAPGTGTGTGTFTGLGESYFM